jgi:serine/threonine-protein kinase
LEFVTGPTLAERIAQGPLPLDEALNFAGQMIEALDYAHQKELSTAT